MSLYDEILDMYKITNEDATSQFRDQLVININAEDLDPNILELLKTKFLDSKNIIVSQMRDILLLRGWSEI